LRKTTCFGSFAILTRIASALALCALIGLGANSAQGQVTVTWNTPSTIAGDTDVATVGTTVFAYYWNGGLRTVNGVSFTGPGAGITVSSPISGPYTDYARGLTGLSADYTAVVAGGIYQSGSFSITLNGLTVGNDYLVQIWVDDSRDLGSLRAQTVSGGGSTSGTLSFPANAAGAPGQYVIGTFTAILANEVLTITGGAGGIAQVNAIQLRDKGGATTTATPIFSPPAGQYYGAQIVTITSQPGSTVFYTTNGSNPNNTSSHGAVGSGFGTVSVPAPITMTIKAYATNSGLADSAIAAGTYVTLPQSSGVWTDLAGGSWTTAASWSNNVVAAGPSATADFSRLSLVSPVTVTLDGDQTIGNLLFDDLSGSQNSWTLDAGTGGTLTLAGVTSTPIISNNVPTALSAAIAGTQGLIKTGTGDLTFTGQDTLGGGVTVNGGSLVMQRPAGSYIGGALVVNSGATLTLDNKSGGTLDGGWENPITINGGTVNVTGSAIVRYGGFSMTGGMFNWSAGGGGFYGPTITTHAASTTAIIDGTGATSYGQPFTFNVARGTAARDLTVSMSIKAAGASVTLMGGGIMEFTGEDTYTGPTTINQGTLLVNSSIENSAVVVNTNGVLGGIGAVNGTVTVKDGGTLTVGTEVDTNAVVGMLTLGNSPVLNSGSTNYLRITKTGGMLASDRINVGTGTLTYGGTLVVADITSGAQPLAAGDTFTLFSASAYGGGFGKLVLPALPSGMSWATSQLGVKGSISVSAAVADVAFSPAPGEYVGAQSVTISCTTPGATIYYTTNGTTPTTSSTVYTGAILVPINTVITINAFAHLSGHEDSAVGSATYVTFPTLTWINPAGGSWPATSNWKDGLVPGARDVTADFSTLTLSSPTYVTLDGSRTVGNLIFGDVGNANTWELDTGGLGVLTLAVSSGTPTITVNNQTTTVGAVLAGTQGLIKAGAGTLQMNVAGAYTGGTTITNGTLSYNLELFNGSGGINLGANNIGSSGTLALHSTAPGTDVLFLRNTVLTGSGTVTKTGEGTLTLWTACNWAAFSGTVDVQTGTLAANNMGGGATAPGMTLNIAEGATFDQRWNAAVAVDKLTGLGTLTDSAASLTFNVGNNNGSSTFGGVIQSSGGTLGLTKNGTGTFTLGGNNTYTGNTTVNGGVLLVKGSIGNSAVTVITSGTLGGNGTINGGVTVNSGGTLAPGTNGFGTLTVNANVTLNAGAIAQFTVGPSSSLLAVTGNLALNGTLNISAGTGFGAGTYSLATYTGSLSGGGLTVGTAPAGYSCTVDTATTGQVKLVVARLPSFSSFGPLSGNSFPLTFSGPTGETYKVLSSTNVALPLANWTVLTTGTFGGGLVTYTDTSATNGLKFSRIVSP
ncbi:MAG: chitobiase/beta-hexosaminidase C-terminal domain-containing protein, partial [Verrucomicrobia bacterium]|nr:chitobiase/beta-hexosaminidase C-terminal domain-containing protein [Verrucomicrobiota bacterium]